MRKKRFTAFLLSMAMAGTSLYTCGVIDVQAAEMEVIAGDQNLELLPELEEQVAAMEEDGSEIPEAEPKAQAEVIVEDGVEEPEQQAAAVRNLTLSGVVDGKAQWGDYVTVPTSDSKDLDLIIFEDAAGKELSEWEYDAPVEMRNQTVTVKGYSGTGADAQLVAQASYTVTVRALTKEMVTFSSYDDTGKYGQVSYNNGSMVRPDLTVSDPDTGIEFDDQKTDYTLEVVPEDYSVGKKQLKITARRDGYEGSSVTVDIEITPKEVTSINVSIAKKEYEYVNAASENSKSTEPPSGDITITDQSGWVMKAGSDYTLSWNNNKNAGDFADMTLAFKAGGSFVSADGTSATDFTKENVFKVVSRNNAEFDVKFAPSANYADGVPVGTSLNAILSTDNLIVSCDGATVSEGDYKAEVKNLTTPSAKVVSTADLKVGEKYQIVITGKGNFAPSSKGTLDFTVVGRKLGISVNVVSGDNVSYNGQPHTLELAVSRNKVSANGDIISTDWVSTNDYDVTYENNKNAGLSTDDLAPTAVVRLKGDYSSDPVRVSFNILQADISSADLKYAGSVEGELTYNGSRQEPSLEASVTLDGTKTPLTKGDDYKFIDSSLSINASDNCVAIISGNGNYKGTQSVNYAIKAKDISTNQMAWTEDIKDKYGYTGQEIHPTFKLSYVGLRNEAGTRPAENQVLVSGSDYSVSYSNAKNIGDEATMVITGIGNYTGTLTRTFTIVPRSFGDVSTNAVPYTGKDVSGNDVKPYVYVRTDDGQLIANSEYHVIVGAGAKNVGKYPLTVSGTNDYYGLTASGNFEIVARDISTNGISINCPETTYGKGGGDANGPFKVPTISISDSGNASGISTGDYEVSCNRTGVNIGTYIVKGIGNYTGVSTGEFVINKADLGKISLSASSFDPYVYTGEMIDPDYKSITVIDNTHGGIALSLNEDYHVGKVPTVSEAGTTYIEIIANTNSDYTGSASVDIVIEPKDIANEDVAWIAPEEVSISADYTGKEQGFEVPTQLSTNCLSYNNMILEMGKDYDVKLRVSDNELSTNYTNAGKYDIVAVGKGNYTGVRVIGTLTVNPKVISADEFYLFKDSFEYTGAPYTPAVIARGDHKQGIDFDVTYPDDSADRGVHYVVLTGKGNYTGEVRLQFTVEALTLSDGNTSANYAGMSENGLPLVQVTADGKTLKYGTDYTYTAVSVEGSDPQQWTVTIEGLGGYEGTVTKTVTFEIIPLVDEYVSVSTDLVYNGEKQAPSSSDVVVKIFDQVLTEGTDYTLAVPDSVDAGTYAVTVSGIGAYTGIATGTYVIKAAAFSQDNVTVAGSVEYTGLTVDPQVTITVDGKTLVQGKDFMVTADEDMVNVGKKTFTITGLGNYDGSTATGTCTITPAALAGANVAVAAVTYTGSAQKANVTSVVKNRIVLRPDVDYTVTPVSRTNAGSVAVTVTGKGNYTGTATGTFVVNTRSLVKGTITGIKDKTYKAGKAVTQGSSMKIAVNGKTLKKGTDYTVTYTNNKKIGQASLVIKGKGNYSGSTTARTFKILPKKATIKSLKAGKKRFTIKTKKQGGGVTYQIHYRLKGSKGTYSRVNTSNVRRVVKSLKKGKTYSVRVRTYKKIGTKMYYGAFSNVKTIKIK